MAHTALELAVQRLLLLVCAVFALAACDASDPMPQTTPPPTPGLRSFVVTGLPPHTEIAIFDTTTVPLPRFGGPDGPVIAAISVSAPAIASVAREADLLRVVARDLGEGTIGITATAPGYRDTTLSLPIRVVQGTCPPVPEGLYDVFPFREASPNGALPRTTTWDFALRQGTEAGTSGGFTWADRGTVRLAFEGVYCRRQTRVGEAVYRIESTGAVERHDVVETADNTIRFSTPRAFGISRTVSFNRYQSNPLLTVPLGLCVDSRVQFESGRGLVEEGYACGGPAGSGSGRRLTRVP